MSERDAGWTSDFPFPAVEEDESSYRYRDDAILEVLGGLGGCKATGDLGVSSPQLPT